MFGGLTDANGFKQRIRRMAVEIYLSGIGIAARTDDQTSAKAPGRDSTATLIPCSQPFRSSPPLEPSQEDPELPKRDNLESGGEDPVSARLRQYARMKPLAGKGEQSALLSQWELGRDPGEDALFGRKAADEGNARRKRVKLANEVHKRVAARLAARGLSDGILGESHSVPSIMTSQPREKMMEIATSSQSFAMPSQSLSQVVPGAHGGRLQNKAKRKKVVGGFR